MPNVHRREFAVGGGETGAPGAAGTNILVELDRRGDNFVPFPSHRARPANRTRPKAPHPSRAKGVGSCASNDGTSPSREEVLAASHSDPCGPLPIRPADSKPTGMSDRRQDRQVCPSPGYDDRSRIRATALATSLVPGARREGAAAQKEGRSERHSCPFLMVS